MEMKYRPWISSVTVAVVAMALAAGGCKGKSSEALLMVDGEPISAEEFAYQLERKPSVIVRTNSGDIQLNVAQPLGFQVANDLVNQKLLIKLAKEKNVYPTDAEVDAEIKFRNTKRKDFVISQTQQGFTLDQIKNDIIIDLCQYKLVTKGVTVTDAEVNDFITKNPKNFREPKLVDILVIVAKDPKTIALVDSDLKSGQSFEAVAKRFSLDKNIQIPERVYDNLAPKLKQIVDKFPKGGVSGWLPDNGFKIKFNIVKVTPPRDVKIEPYMKEDIRRLIAANKGSKTVNLQKMLSDKRTQAKVIVNKQTLKLPCEALDKELQKQAKDAKQKK